MPPSTNPSIYPPSAGLPPLPPAVPLAVPPTMGNFSVPPPSTYPPAGASTRVQAPTAQSFSFSGAGPPYATFPLGGGRSGLPPEQREGGYWSREEPDEYHGRPRVRGESSYNDEDRNGNFGHHRQGRPTDRTRPKTPEVCRDSIDP